MVHRVLVAPSKPYSASLCAEPHCCCGSSGCPVPFATTDWCWCPPNCLVVSIGRLAKWRPSSAIRWWRPTIWIFCGLLWPSSRASLLPSRLSNDVAGRRRWPFSFCCLQCALCCWRPLMSKNKSGKLDMYSKCNPNDSFASRTTLTIILFLARGVIAGLFQAAYIYTPEVYPTALRSVGVGGCSTLARLGAMATPYVAQVIIQ